MGLACQAPLRVVGRARGRAVGRAVRGTPSDVYHFRSCAKGGGSEASVYRWFVKGV